MAPTAEPPVPITRLQLGAAEHEAVARVLRSGWIMQGAEVAAFEAELAAAVGAPHAVAVANGTLALELALRALEVGPGDEVITVSHSFVATANAVRMVGATPVFADVEADTFGLDPAALPALFTARTRAVIAAHQFGIPCDLAAVVAACEARGVPLIEDAACAIGTTIALPSGELEPVGRPRGALACFSFHPRKVVTTGEGGMVTTRDARLAERVRLLRSHGMTLPPERRHADPAARERYVVAGTNARLTDLAAALGRPQLARLPAIVAERRRLAERFRAALDGHALLQAPVERPGARGNYQSFPVLVTEGSGWTAPQVIAALQTVGVGARRGILNAHEEPAYADVARGPLPVSEALARRTAVLPLFHGMTPDEADRVVAAVRSLR